MKKSAIFAAAAAMFLTAFAAALPPEWTAPTNGVLLLTFDDQNYDNWLAATNLFARYGKYKTVAKVDPKAKPTEDEREQLTLWAVPLIDNINTWTLNFITGKKDINRDWDEYAASCRNLNVDKIVDLTNKIYKGQK